MNYIFIIVAVIFLFCSLFLIKKGKEKKSTYIVAIFLLFCSAASAYVGTNRINNTPYVYEIVKNSEISKGKFQVQLNRKNSRTIVFLPALTEEQAKDFKEGAEVTLTNNEIQRYT